MFGWGGTTETHGFGGGGRELTGQWPSSGDATVRREAPDLWGDRRSGRRSRG
ncbi:hypothetical protein TIFTF001_004231 [Ficus carica]|uniref:Uncharacterized protein n=1 Tax=Ficus carica TaxID=3494 RepID=A0AA87ZHW6_FICCA|nr:hypothetical protein TIFTF001_004231 [Ficus carica]